MVSAFIQFSDITWEVIVGGFAIAVARVFDVSLGVLRLSAQAAGRKKAAWGFAFLEALIWVIVVSSVVTNLDNPILALFFSLGFASGTWVGLTLEGWLAKGEQVVRVFTHLGDEMADEFRARGWRVTQFEGKGRDGPIQLLFIHARRKVAPRISRAARQLDAKAFIVVDDIRASHGGNHGAYPHMMRK